jgi:hypothetical protein
VYAGLLPGTALAEPNAQPGVTPENAVVGSQAVNGGRILCTAAINSNGTIATTLTGSFIDSTKTFRITKGQYQVRFKGPCGNVQGVNGWFHIVQVDTLTTGNPTPAICQTADRAGVPSAIFCNLFLREPNSAFCWRLRHLFRAVRFAISGRREVNGGVAARDKERLGSRNQ